MVKEFIHRENEIFDILDKLHKESIEFFLVGGYAVSAFKHRFSVDADIVVKEEQLQQIKNILDNNKFAPFKSKVIENMYDGKFESFMKKTPLPITVDLMINALCSRNTNASWSFDLFAKNSIEKEIKGIEKSIKAKLPCKELLIATKIHSSRLTDIRDIVAISDGIDFNKIAEFTVRGDHDELKICINKMMNVLKDKNFIDAFKGVFSIEKFPHHSVEHTTKMIHELLSKLQ